jgi:DNA invertase Pin-like site-specific DNA recombinase
MSQKQYTFRCVAYCRVSSADQVSGILTVKGSLEEQEQKARAYAKSQGWEYVKTYIEPGVSGEKFTERTALQQMLEDAASGSFDCVVIRAGDRLARDQEIFFRITKILNHQFNIQILSMANPSQIVDPSLFNGRRNSMLIIQQGLDSMMAAFDQSRRIDMLEEGKRRQIRAGRYLFSVPPYGYRFERKIIGGVRVERIPVPEPGEYEIIERLPGLVLEEHLSAREIAVRFEESGMPKPRNSPHWTKAVIANLLDSPFYGGKLTYGKTTRRIGADGRLTSAVNRNPDTFVQVEHPYQHPWTWETYQRIQDRIRDRSVNPGKQHVSRSPLAGMLVCGFCGHPMTFKQASRKARTVYRWRTRKDGSRRLLPYRQTAFYTDYYVCGYHNENRALCQVNRISYKNIMRAVTAEIQEVRNAELVDPVGFYAGFQRADLTGKINALEGKLEASKRELRETLVAKTDRLNRGYLNGLVDEDQYPVLTRMIKDERERVVQQIAELESELSKTRASNQNVARLRQFNREFEIYIEKLSRPAHQLSDDEPRKIKHWLGLYFAKISVKEVGEPGRPQSSVHYEARPLD